MLYNDGALCLPLPSLNNIISDFYEIFFNEP